MHGMAFQFDAQDHQEECVKSIMDALDKDPDNHSLRLKSDCSLDKQFPQKPTENRLDILMETGTGKTYTYIKTIFEMYKKFHKTKFVIIVPRMSIRHGVVQNIKHTANHFFTAYGRRLRCVNYPDDKIESVTGSFIDSNDLSVLLITNSAFNSKDNLINRYSETLHGGATVWERVTGLSPVVIMDEPHLLAGGQTKEHLKILRSKSLVIRFGATYPQSDEDGISNVVYALDSISAFNKKLVKRISVSVVSSRTEEGNVHVTGTHGRKRFTIRYTVNGQGCKANVHLDEDLWAATGLSMYRGKRATNIKSSEVILNDGRHLPVGAYDLTDDEIRQMVCETIRLHFKRERTMFEIGIKTLSLFFIPRANDFREDGRIKKIFEEAYVEERQKTLEDGVSEEYRKYLEQDYDEDGDLRVHNGYFSRDRGSKDKREADAVDTILKNKGKLLSLAEPLRFIFSVWALQEGWDNPNVFNICKLSHTTKENSRRQQAGRGMRIAVDRHNMRMTEDRLSEERKAEFYDVNELNMVVPAYESTFIEEIQREIHDDSPSTIGSKITLDSLRDAGLDDMERSIVFAVLVDNGQIDKNGNRLSSIQEFLESNKDVFPQIKSTRIVEIGNILQDTSGAVVDGNKKRMVSVRSDKWKEFKSLWEQINRGVRMVYKNIDEDDIIQTVCELFEKADIPAARTTIEREVYNADTDTVEKVEKRSTGDSDYFQKVGVHEHIIGIARDHRWPVGFLLEIFNRIELAKYKSNPEEAKRLLTDMIQRTIHHTILEKVEYKFAETTIYGNGLQRDDGTLLQTIQSTKLGKKVSNETPPDEFLYDTITFDSDIELRSIRDDFMKQMYDNRIRDITVFAKLPHIHIPTPDKTYNPDFAYVISNGDAKTLFLVVETKGYDNYVDIPEDQRKKIEYGKRFFESLRKVLPDGVELCFRERLDRDEMVEILRRCCSE